MWRPLIWRRVECYYGQVGRNQAEIWDLNPPCLLSSVQSCKVYPSWAEETKYIEITVISLNNFYTQQSAELFFLSTSPTTWMFLVYPIRPHFLGHNFLSLNPSISDKRNIQTLGGDSERNIWCGPILSFIFSVSIEIFKSCQVLLVSSSLSTWLYKWILLSYDVVITMFVLENVLPSQLPLSLLILLCIAWGVYLYHYEDIYGEKPYFRER